MTLTPRKHRHASRVVAQAALWTTSVGGLALVACGSGLRAAPTGSHPANAQAQIVDRRPPPAKVEAVTKDPGDACVWLDGQWTWYGQRWEWTPGGWVTPPEGCYFAPPLVIWAQTSDQGELVHTPGRWYSERDGSPCAEATRCGR